MKIVLNALRRPVGVSVVAGMVRWTYKKLWFWTIHYFTSQFYNFFQFGRSLSFVGYIIYQIWTPVCKATIVYFCACVRACVCVCVCVWGGGGGGDVSVLQVCKLNTSYDIKFYKYSAKKILPNVNQKMFHDVWRPVVKHSVVHGCWFIDYLTKELHLWEKTHANVITLLIANIAWEILIPQIYIDFHGWKTVRVQENYC